MNKYTTFLIHYTEKSTASIRATSSQHDALTTVMDTSKQLITALEKADWLDRLLVLAALMFFVLVVLFILKQRILDRSFRLAFFWTRFLPSSGRNAASDTVLRKAEEGSASLVKTVLETVSAVSSTIVPVASSIGLGKVALPSTGISEATSLPPVNDEPSSILDILEDFLSTSTPLPSSQQHVEL